MENESKPFFDGISRAIYQNASAAIAKLRDWISGEKEEPGDEGDTVIGNSIALKGILKKKPNKPKLRAGKFQKVFAEALQLMKLQTRRRERSDGCIRQGPLPSEDIPASERGPSKLTHARLNPSQMSGKSEIDEANPTNRGMLTYFARIGQQANQDERVDLTFVRSLLTAGADINIGDKYGQTILHAIARDWHIDVAKFVVNNNGDVNARDKFGRTPLHVAAAVDYPEMIEFLVLNGANVHCRTDGELQTPIHYAAKFNAVASLECLLRFGAKVSDRDYKDRTPLFLAAEQGRRDVIKFFLNLGVAVAVYDEQGNSAASLMIEKMPDLALQALDQYIVEDKPNRTTYFYLSNLEYSTSCKFGMTPARSVLETLAYNRDKNLAQHDVIYKLIETKWQMIAKKKALLEIGLNFIYACVGTALAVSYEQTSLYTPLSKKGWRIGVEALFVLMTLFFIIRQVKRARLGATRHRKWQKWRIRWISLDFKYCHPQWPEEKAYLKKETARIRDMSGRSIGAWAYYEWINFLTLIAIIISQGITFVKPSKQSKVAMKFCYTINVFVIWLRLLQPCKTIRALSGLIVMLGDIAKGSIQYLYIFMEFFVPLVTAFYVLFGGHVNAQKMKASGASENDIKSFETLDEMTFNLAWVTMGGPLSTGPLEAVDKKLANVMVSLLYALMKIISANLFISLLSHLFQRTYNTAKATALLESADYIIQEESNLAWKQAKKCRKKMRMECSPLETYNAVSSRTKQTGIELETIMSSISEQTKALDKAFNNKEKKVVENQGQKVLHSAKIVAKCLEDTAQMQEGIEKEFKKKLEKIKENQAQIKSLLAKPEVTNFILKRSGRGKETRDFGRSASTSH